MDEWSSATSVTYKRWRNPEHNPEGNPAAPNADSSRSMEENCSVTVGRLKSPRSPAADSTRETSFSLDEALDALGFGSFQWKLLFLTGFSWVADAMEMMILGILGPQLHCEWSLPGYKVALITSVVFAGMCFSSSLWGNLSDKYGRKKGLTVCMCWTFYYSVLSALAPDFCWILVLRGLVGFGIGGAHQSVTLYSELLPCKRRGLAVILIAAFWALGAVFEVLLALWVMPTLGWRWLLGLSSTPLAIFLCFCLWLPESPRFDLLNGDRGKVMATLERIARDNGKALPRGRMVCDIQRNDRGRLRDLFTRQYYKTTLLLWFIWFSFAFTYYGIILLTTEMFQSGDSCGATQGAKTEPSCRLECTFLTSEDYRDLLWTTFAEFPGLVVVLGTVDCLGRKKSMALPLFIFTLSILPLYACIGRMTLTVFIFIGRAFISGGFQVVYVYTPEVFPTEIRSLAVGTCSAVSKVGALITPFVAQVLLRHSVSLTLTLYCLCSLLAGLMCLLLPVETSGRALRESERTPALGSAKRAP
ncbi:LOW QUALITY PROTEIN: synaptic vesicle 2-related protein-like [Phycodurus eques]|uniref:LOW QUALITY PROTEIN: synaptic vesicle 2-related protein-like n=1 Tax=Phycodurus eques TaxID=693459 RepID=UPI002ACEF0CD|nr:LOW QUALITY PROTEIN: synaptic vesicle 2-related protein-like [Phycodurus eques]